MAKLLMDNVSVEFPIYNASNMSLRHRLLDVSTGGLISRKSRDVINVKALDAVNLHLNDGDRIGIVGHNGAGKSTLLRTMAGIYYPTSGLVKTEGRVSSILDLNAGMSMDLTGYENVIRVSLMYGLSKEEAEENILEIEEFTELGNFMAAPVRTYSMGMLMRLLFAIATSTKPDILLIDEIMGAGDAAFQEKALSRISKFIENASILVLASHSMEMIEMFCNKIVKLDHGKITVL